MANPTAAHAAPKLIQTLNGKIFDHPPIWLMRQAGRYLPEYRELRARSGGFLEMCYTPAVAAEITLQPIRRFGFDAAILFSDILVVPDALGQKVEFSEGVGPQLDGMEPAALLSRLNPTGLATKFDLVCETVARVRGALPAEVALIGFCGAPWTVATYMIAGHSTPDQAPARLAAYRDPAAFTELLTLLADVSAAYLSAQIEAGAQAVQIFDSWAGVLPDDQFERWVVAPTARMVRKLRANHPAVPIIGFPRGASAANVADYAKRTGVSAMGCDTSLSLIEMRALSDMVPMAVQGNLDPLLLVAGGPLLESRIVDIIGALRSNPFIFNLGHGILQTTPIAHVERLVALVRGDGQG